MRPSWRGSDLFLLINPSWPFLTKSAAKIPRVNVTKNPFPRSIPFPFHNFQSKLFVLPIFNTFLCQIVKRKLFINFSDIMIFENIIKSDISHIILVCMPRIYLWFFCWIHFCWVHHHIYRYQLILFHGNLFVLCIFASWHLCSMSRSYPTFAILSLGTLEWYPGVEYCWLWCGAIFNCEELTKSFLSLCVFGIEKR